MMINADIFYKDAQSVSFFGERWIHISYKEFLNFFLSKEKLTPHDFVIGAYFTYGWMPKMLKLSGDIDEVTAIVNKSKRGLISIDEFTRLAGAINGSVVGASKLLHFINPKDYAIWDSRVYRYLHQEAPYQYRLEASNAYWEYLGFLNLLAEDSRFKYFSEKVFSTIGYPVTDKRACELMMFVKGKKENQSRSIQAGSQIGDVAHGKFTTSSPEFKNKVLKYAESYKQKKAMEMAAKEFRIQLPSSYLLYPGSHINRWRNQGFPK